MKNLLPTIFVTLAIIGCSCDTTEPPIDIKPSGKRSYLWSSDSINRPGFPYITSIWGSSTTDVWGAGFSADARDCLWHYDGVSWKRAAEGTPISTSGNGSPIVGGLLGLTNNELLAFGNRIFSTNNSVEPFLMKFDGNKWEEITNSIHLPDGYIDSYFISENDFWISTVEDVFHYFNGNWAKYFIGENYIIQSIEGIGNNVYLMAYPVGIDRLYLMKFNGNTFNTIDETNLFGEGKFGNFGMVFSQNSVFVFDYEAGYMADLTGDQIEINTWRVMTNPPIKKTVNTFKISENDIWAVGGEPYPYHFNGSDWKAIDIYGSSNILAQNKFWGVWGEGNEIFIVDINNGIIHHGK